MKPGPLTILIALLGLAAAGWFLFGRISTPPVVPAPSAAPPGRSIPAQPPEPPTPETAPDPLAEALARLKAAPTSVNFSNVLDRLATLQPAEVSGALQKLLNETLDGPTGQSFRISANGSLAEAPTLRTALLNKLIQIDPAAAARKGREILNSMDSPDEWAVSLRAVAIGEPGDPATLDYLRQKSRQMLTHEAWQKSPSIGFLEAFDVVVHNADTEFIPELTRMVNQKENPAIAHAAYLTVDRLIINQPGEVLSQLLENPEQMADRPETRANYFARADLRDEGQRRLVEDYLLNPALSPNELATFAGIFPNANYMISHNLLSRSITPDGTTLRARDRAALQVLDQWLNEARFEPIRSSIQKARTRLAGFVDN